MVKRDIITVYPTQKMAFVGLLAGVAVLIVLIVLVFNVREGSTVSFLTGKAIVVPNILLLSYKIIASILIILLLLIIRSRVQDLFHTTPLMLIKENGVEIRRLLSVDKVNWVDIESVKFVRSQKIQLLHLIYTLENKSDVRKTFKCNTSKLNISETKLEEELSSRTQNSL